MVSIESFRGTAEELAEFVTSVWSGAYSGKMTFPLWTPDYFRWQLRFDGGDRRHLIAAYDDSRLVGVLLGSPLDLRTPAGVVPGSQWSWLSIHPDYQSRKIVPDLDAERVRRQQAGGSRLIVSHRFVGSKHSLAERPNTKSPNKIFLRTLGFWFRILDTRRFAVWHYNRIEASLARLARPFAGVRRGQAPGVSIERFSNNDLDDALRVVSDSTRDAELAVHWTRETLGPHLTGSPVGQSLVLKEGGRLTGVIAFHVLPFQGRTIANVGIIDIIAFSGATTRGKVLLLRAALAEMAEQQAVVAVKLNCGDTEPWPMRRNLFIRERPESALVLQWNGTPVPIPPRSRLHVLWR